MNNGVAWIFMLLISVVSWPCYSAEPPFEFRKTVPPAKNSDGVAINFSEVERTVADGVTQIKYAISFGGLVSGKDYALAMKGPGIPWVGMGDAANGIEFSMRSDGGLFFKKSGANYASEFIVNKFVLGEYRDFGLRSTDGEIYAKYRLVPFPLEVRDGACRIAMVIADPNAEVYFLEGYGFAQNANITITLVSGNRTSEEKALIDEEGRIRSLVILNHSADRLKGKISAPASGDSPPIFIEQNRTLFLGRHGGDATVKILDKTCAPEIHYKWGTEAKKFQ